MYAYQLYTRNVLYQQEPAVQRLESVVIAAQTTVMTLLPLG
jgi:hypothetical protein